MATPGNLKIENYDPYVMNNGGVNTALPLEVNNDVTVTGTVFDGEEKQISVTSNGTTAVSVFGASGLDYAINITRVYLISDDTTATNITVEAPAATNVCTIAKGTTAGAMVGATTLTNNTDIPAGTNVVVDGSGAGIAQVFITYEPA